MRVDGETASVVLMGSLGILEARVRGDPESI